jgi:hypothetical protein
MFDTNALEQIKRIPQTNTTTFLDKQNPTTKSTKKNERKKRRN